MYNKCSICGEWGWENTHKCNPKFYVWRKWEGLDDIENSKIIYANDWEDAAVKYAESDWEFPNSEEVYVCLVSDYNCICDKFLNDDCELSQEGAKVLEKICKIYCLESEIVRNFYAHEKDSSGEKAV